MPSPDSLQGDGGTCIARPEIPPVELSHWVPGPHGRQAWLRFPAPGLPGDTAWAQVFEPEGAVNPPPLISLHGIGVERSEARRVGKECVSTCCFRMAQFS